MNDHQRELEYVHKPMIKFSGALSIFFLLHISQNIDGFRQKQILRLLDFIKLYEQNPFTVLDFFFLHYLPKLYLALCICTVMACHS